MFCTQCGQQNADDSKFCARCGAPTGKPATVEGVENTSTISLAALEGAIDGTAQADHEQPDEAGSGVHESLPPGTALLVVKRGPNAGSRFLLDSDITTAGRHPESDIFLDDVTVSRRHAEFVRDPASDGFQVKDVGSLNGTYLNRERIESAALTGGDEVQIGKYRLVFLTGHRGDEGS